MGGSAGRKLRCGNLFYVQCPRCEQMATSKISIEGEPFAVGCAKCGLSGTQPLFSTWDVIKKRQVEHHASMRDAIFAAWCRDRWMTIWEGDVLVAEFRPGVGSWYLAGRCAGYGEDVGIVKQ